jgi:hypothetical protein
MPGGPAGWLKSFGFLQFARAVEEEVAGRRRARGGITKAQSSKLGAPVPEEIITMIREYGDARADGSEPGTRLANIVLALRRHYRPAAQVQAEVRDDEPAAAAIDLAIQRACRDLPDDYEISIELECGSGCALWRERGGDWNAIDGEGYLSDDIDEALERATVHAAMKSNRAASTASTTEEKGADHE